MNVHQEVCVLTINTFWTIFKVVKFFNKLETSRFKNDPYLKHLKSWVINNGYYVDSGTAEE